jgi:hypothetical protein
MLEFGAICWVVGFLVGRCCLPDEDSPLTQQLSQYPSSTGQTVQIAKKLFHDDIQAHVVVNLMTSIRVACLGFCLEHGDTTAHAIAATHKNFAGLIDLIARPFDIYEDAAHLDKVLSWEFLTAARDRDLAQAPDERSAPG